MRNVGLVMLALALGCDARPIRIPHAPTSPIARFHAAGGYGADELAGLRAEGPAGLAKVGSALDAAGAQGNAEARAGLRDALDQVAQQKDAYASRLYWYTDLEEAKRAARATGRPIVSLRLLGNLTDELSCANSRFFRTMLYPSDEVRTALASGYVLHWSSERPAPVIRIDFGDGRIVTRTVTGNSIHYLLDAEGRPLDALPGLVGPHAFAEWLAKTAELRSILDLFGREAGMAKYHGGELTKLESRYHQELAQAGLPQTPFFALRAPPKSPPPPTRPPAAMAMPIAPSKAVGESPMLRGFAPPAPPPPVESIDWKRLAPFHAKDAKLDAAGRAILRAKNPRDWTQANDPPPLDDAGFDALVGRFESTLAEDTAKNELALHAKIHAWLTETPILSFEELNRRVYDTLFLTPRADPWLGLMPAGVFTGIQDDGITR